MFACKPKWYVYCMRTIQYERVCLCVNDREKQKYNHTMAAGLIHIFVAVLCCPIYSTPIRWICFWSQIVTLPTITFVYNNSAGVSVCVLCHYCVWYRLHMEWVVFHFGICLKTQFNCNALVIRKIFCRNSENNMPKERTVVENKWMNMRFVVLILVFFCVFFFKPMSLFSFFFFMSLSLSTVKRSNIYLSGECLYYVH